MSMMTIIANSLNEGQVYEVVTNSGHIYERLIFMGRTDWLGRPVFLFKDFDLKEEIQLNPSYIESIKHLNLPIEILKEEEEDANEF